MVAIFTQCYATSKQQSQDLSRDSLTINASQFLSNLKIDSDIVMRFPEMGEEGKSETTNVLFRIPYIPVI